MRFFNKNFLQILLVGIILVFVYKFADSIDYIINGVGFFFEIISPIIIAVIIAFFIHRPVCRVEEFYKKAKIKFISKKSRLLGLITIYAVILAAIVIIVNYIGPRFAKNIKELINNLPRYTGQLEALLEKSEFVINEEWIKQIENKVIGFFEFSRITKYIGVVSSIASSFISFFISIVLSAYMILDKEHIFEFLKKIKNRFFRNKTSDIVIYYLKKCVNLFYSYFSGLAFDAALIGIITSIVLSFFRVPYSVLLGVIVAVGNLIPFFGAIVSNIIVYVIVSFSFGPLKALWVLLFQFVLGQVDGNFIQPKIIGNSVGISPFMVLIAVTVFGGLFGPIGMIVGVPVMAVFKIVFDDYFENKRLNTEKSDIDE